MFSGFDQQTFHFLRDLAQNNNRDWFKSHKQDYLDHVQGPAIAFVEAMGERLREVAPGIRYDTRTNGAGSLMRIYRDIRFSKDKTPHKTNVGIVFWEGAKKKMECPGYYVHIDATGGKVYGGLYRFPKAFLPLYRQAVDSPQSASTLERAIQEVEAAGDYEVNGDRYKRVPRGFDAEHPKAELLKYKGMHAESPDLPISALKSAELVDLCIEHCKAMAPLHRWFVDVDG